MSIKKIDVKIKEGIDLNILKKYGFEYKEEKQLWWKVINVEQWDFIGADIISVNPITRIVDYYSLPTFNYNLGECIKDLVQDDLVDIDINKEIISKTDNKDEIMTKTNLENGMVVEVRNGNRYLVHNDKFINKQNFNYFDDYDDEFNNIHLPSFDIVKIYKSISFTLDKIFNDNNLVLIWEREDKTKLSEKDKDDIKNGLKKIQEECRRYKYCDEKCELRLNDDCIFSDSPNSFKIDDLFNN